LIGKLSGKNESLYGNGGHLSVIMLVASQKGNKVIIRGKEFFGRMSSSARQLVMLSNGEGKAKHDFNQLLPLDK